MLLRTAGIVASIVCLSLLSGCHEDVEGFTAERGLITASDGDAGTAPRWGQQAALRRLPRRSRLSFAARWLRRSAAAPGGG